MFPREAYVGKCEISPRDAVGCRYPLIIKWGQHRASSHRTLLEVVRSRLASRRAFTANICACFDYDRYCTLCLKQRAPEPNFVPPLHSIDPDSMDEVLIHLLAAIAFFVAVTRFYKVKFISGQGLRNAEDVAAATGKDN